jgi:hypothetical protein
MRDTLQKVLEGVTYISLREDKPSVSTSLRMATNGSPDICADQSGSSYSPIYISWRRAVPRRQQAGGVMRMMKQV